MTTRAAMPVHGSAAPADPLTALVGAWTRRRKPLDEASAYTLMRALLDDALATADRKAVLDVFADRWPTAAEASGFGRALTGDTRVLGAPVERSGPIVLTSYATATSDAAATALLALLLERYGVAVVVVRAGDDAHARASAIIETLGVRTSPDLERAEARLKRAGVACVPIGVVAPGAARLLRSARGNRVLLALAKLIDPCGEAGVRAIAAQEDDERAWLHQVIGSTRSAVLLPPAGETAPTPAQVVQILAGGRPVPAQTLAQLGSCLDAVRRRDR